ncbi:hypothetical protein FHW12_004084 [Dokdonella fugitiva]|uniref:Uncharacterized protein n=1 Tax=Dokdonella fugitiva TaxID=328517 RepID=A0A839EYP9_9GAMM|nr:hypothetical protein [Dokdonella fugitiva]MBA8889837.1 hypothetical protein [Dokdonella fugitiva]
MKRYCLPCALVLATAFAGSFAHAVDVAKVPVRVDDGAARIDAPPRVARKGMTWGVGVRVSADPGIVFVSCHGRPAIGGHGCDAYQGDTACSAKRPVLCVEVDGRARPDGIATPPSGGVMHAGFYSGWAHGRVALTRAVRGDAFARRSDADAYCAARLGAGWRVAEHHDGVDEQGGHGGWGFVAEGRIASRSRFWVAIDDTGANCWDPRR